MNSQTTRDRLVYDYIWERQEERPPSDTFAAVVAALAANKAGANRLADLGCGIGRHALHAARAGFDVTAVDHSARAVARLRESAAGLHIHVVEGDAFAWIAAQPPASFDGIVCFDAVHHLSPDRAAVERAATTLRTALRPGGHLLVTLLCDIAYSSCEQPPGRLRVDVAGARDLLDRAVRDADVLREKEKDVEVPDTVSMDKVTGELTGTAYQARRLLRWYRAH